MKAAAVKPTDILFRDPGFGDQFGGDTFPIVPGMDAAGIIESVGPGVSRLHAGEKVMAAVMPVRPEGGAQAQHIVVPAASPIKHLADLKGRKVAVTKGAGAHYLLIVALQHAGLTFTDIQPAYLSPAEGRAALMAGEIAKSAEFFSYGTNDLTQTTYGLSRDDAASFLSTYQKQGIFEQDPFVSLDVDGVGELVQIASERGRRARKKLKLGICGEHGGDPASIQFCQKVGLDYVSCSPYRVPIARLAAAQAAISTAPAETTA